MISRFLKWFWVPAVRYTWGAIFIVGGLAGIIFWGGFNTAMEATNTMTFCVSCHEMRDNVYEEYTHTIHFENRTGVRASCSDCHVPDPWVYKVVRKIKATNELVHKVLGTVDTPEKFEAKRLTLAKSVWKDMKQTDSRECRNCHSWDAMSSEKQARRARKQHISAREDNMTCIDCHKGIAHRSVHKLLDEDEDPYDGKPDDRHLGPKVKAEKAAPAPEAKSVPTPTPPAVQVASVSSGAWDGVPISDITLLYPGQASLEWVLNGRDHGGGRAVRRINDRCLECHKGDEANMGQKIVTGSKAEATPIPGKRGSIPVKLQAMHDGEVLKLRFQWPDAEHTPVPFVDGGKMDPKNQIKLAVMFDDGKVETASYTGCWASCHNDNRYMPDHPTEDALAAAGAVSEIFDTKSGITKYIPESRSELDYKGKDGKPRGGWDKLIDKAEMETRHKDGVFMDLIRFSSGSKVMESGSIMGERALAPTDKMTGTATLSSGVWTVEVSRPLKADQPGGVSFEPDQIYTMGFAVHDDFTSARFHHVSLEYRIGLDNPEAEINVVKR